METNEIGTVTAEPQAPLQIIEKQPFPSDGQALDAIIDLVRKAEGKQPYTIESPRFYRPVVIVDGKALELESHLAHPDETRLEVTFTDTKSFMEYVNEFKAQPLHYPTRFTRIYACEGKSRFEAVIDDHGPGVPSWRLHRAILQLTPDRDLVAWREADNKAIKREDFAELLDSLAHTIAEPDAATIRELVQRFTYTRVIKYEQPKFDERSGSVSYSITDDTDETRTEKLPPGITVCCPVFDRAKPLDIQARLMFRAGTNTVNFGVRFDRLDRIVRLAFEQVAEEIYHGTGITPLFIP